MVETPGHSLDHVSLYEPDQHWLFSGDAFIGGQDRAWSPEFDMFATIGSLRTMIALRPLRLFPGSGHVRKDPMTDLQGKLLFLTNLCAQVADLQIQLYRRAIWGMPQPFYSARIPDDNTLRTPNYTFRVGGDPLRQPGSRQPLRAGSALAF